MLPGASRISPYLNEARNNLTALSQRQNLFFVAMRDHVLVYQPRYPNQFLDRAPEVILRLPEGRSRIVQSMDPRQPFAINQIIVGNLGSQEVLVVARDDGDAMAFVVDKIHEEVRARQGMRKRLQLHSAAPDAADSSLHLQPFFHHHCGKGVWGLAMHEQARMIAVSTNDHCVTVFAFALDRRRHPSHVTPSSPAAKSPTPVSTNFPAWGSLQDHDAVLDEVEYDQDWLVYDAKPSQQALLHSRRSLNIKIKLSGHHCNIPSVSFCNTGDDPNGHYVVGTGINGTTIIWSTATMMQMRKLPAYHVGDSALHAFCPGWGVFWIPREAFLTTRIPAKAFGANETTKWEDKARNLLILKSATHLPNQNTQWRTTAPFSHPFGAFQFLPAGMHEDMELEMDPATDALEDEETDTRDVLVQNPNDFGIFNAFQLAFEQADWGQDDDATADPFDFSPPGDERFFFDWPFASLATGRFGQHPRNTSRAQYENVSIRLPPLCLLSSKSAHLLQDAQFHGLNGERTVLSVVDPLRQFIRNELLFMHIDMFDRMNLHALIPELGVVVAGSGKGRVALFTLHALEPHPFAPSSPEPFRTMRLDHVLPTKEQEDRGERPSSWLVGVAVSPVQGHVGRRGARRWRLMLTYKDLTTLSYEICHMDNAGAERPRF